MKKIIGFISAAAMIVMAFFIACEQQNDQLEQTTYLTKGLELAQELGGLYFREGNVSITKDTDNGQKRLQLALTNGGIKPHIVTVFLEKADWEQLNLKSGKYEVLFLKHLLILNDPHKGMQHTFRVQSSELKDLEVKLPRAYLSSAPIEAIGISFQGPLPTLKGNPENLGEVCHSSGGTGSISCSNACCTISCKTGYYATCGQSCNCTKEE